MNKFYIHIFIRFFLFSLFFIRIDIKTRLKILKILEIIFNLRQSFIDNDDQLIFEKSFLFTSIQLLTAILLYYYPSISNDSEIFLKFNENSIEDFEIIELTIKLLYKLIQFCKTDQSKILLHVLTFSTQ